jgi:hypothetical protein
MATGENEQALQRIIELLRLLSVVTLLLHFYLFLHQALMQWNLTHPLLDHIIGSIRRTWVFAQPLNTKLFSIGLLLVSLLGAKGRKDETISAKISLLCMAAGLCTFLLGHLHTSLPVGFDLQAGNYAFLTSASFLSVLTGGIHLSRSLPTALLRKDIFNRLNESFPQEERLIENEYSINLPAQYNYRGRIRSSWINVINPFRSLLVIGTPGAGKSYFVIRHVITQHIKKGFTMFLYDFKFDDLSRIAYNTLIRYQDRYEVAPRFYVINFEDLSRTHRCNPLDPSTMIDITDATESSRTIMLGLNRDWIKKQGDFFVESPINFVTAIIWFLRKHDNGRYCTLPHVIELMQLEYPTLFKLLRSEPEIEVLINPFESAFRNEAMEQLEGQIASAKIGLARLSSPQLYYVLSKNEFTLDVNNPAEPKVVCIGNNPQKQQIYGAVLSLYISRVIRLVNKKNQLKSSLLFDEFPTIYFNGIDGLIATARSNKVATTLAVQDYSQLKKDYGREQAEVIMNIVGNVISGQVVGETAKLLSERFGKIVQERESISINSSDTSVSRSTQLDSAVPPSRIASLSSGEFVGTVSDDPHQKIELKSFHAQIINDHLAIKREEDAYKEIPVIRSVTPFEIQENYFQIKKDIERIVSQHKSSQL